MKPKFQLNYKIKMVSYDVVHTNEQEISVDAKKVKV